MKPWYLKSWNLSMNILWWHDIIVTVTLKCLISVLMLLYVRLGNAWNYANSGYGCFNLLLYGNIVNECVNWMNNCDWIVDFSADMEHLSFIYYFGTIHHKICDVMVKQLCMYLLLYHRILQCWHLEVSVALLASWCYNQYYHYLYILI